MGKLLNQEHLSLEIYRFPIQKKTDLCCNNLVPSNAKLLSKIRNLLKDDEDNDDDNHDGNAKLLGEI